MQKKAPTHTELIVALDFQKPEKALGFVDQLQNLPVVYKVGLELFLTGGPEVIRELVRRKHRVFLDLKFYDIPNTVARASLQAALLNVEMFTVHLSGGEAMIQAIVRELDEISEIRPKIIGVSVLTSFDDLHWAKVMNALNGHAADVDDSVIGLATHATAWGADGIVCSAQELPQIRKQFPALYTVVPGIRPKGVPAQDQMRVVTPREAKNAGAHAIVVGRPITSSNSPKAVVESILQEIQ